MHCSTAQPTARPFAPLTGLAKRLVTLAGAALVLAACGDKSNIAGNVAPLASITVTPSTQTLAVNGTQQFAAAGRDASGGVVALSPVWSIVAGGGTISSTGLFTAGTASGTFTATIKATSGAISATSSVVVTPGPIASMAITTGAVSVIIGGTRQLVAEAKDAFGNVVAVTPTWSIVAGGGSVNATGLVTAGMVVGAFTNTLQASSGGVSGTATLTVTAGPAATIVVTPGPSTLGMSATQQFTAVAKDAGGNVVAITPVWTVVAGGGTIGTSGLFTAGTTTGTFTNTISAVSGTITGLATVIVTGGPLSTITISVPSATVPIGGTFQFTAVGRDANGNIVTVAPTWSVVSGGGTIDAATGLFTAGTATGTYTNTVRAAVGGTAGVATVVVTGGPATSMIVTPNPASMPINGTQQFTASARDINGNVTPVTAVWSVVNGGGSINSTTGLFTAGAVAGAFANTVTATSGSLSATATVTVTPAGGGLRLVSITVTPNPVTMLANGTQQFTATGRDQNGSIFLISPTWSVVNGGGTITAAGGLFTAGPTAGTFLNTVAATSGAVSGTATVNVMTVAPPPPFVSLGAAAPNGIMAGTAVTCVANGIINADVSISPGNTLTGFGPCVITGTRNLNTAPAMQAQIDLTTAYNTLAGLPCPTAPSFAIVANLGGTTLPAGVYCTASGIGVTGILTLDGGGDPNAVFVFKAGTGLTTAGNIVLINGAQAKNVYWQVGSSATIGTASQWQGNILALTSITLVDNATLFGRALARNGAVTLGTNNLITLP